MSLLSKGATHKVGIIRDKPAFKVKPGKQKACAGDTVVFHSAGAGAVHLFFPKAILRDAAGQPIHRLTVDAATDASGEVFGEEGTYTYVAFCEESDDVAVGDSQPKIIIYR